MNYKKQAPTETLPDLAPADAETGGANAGTTAAVEGLTSEYIQDTLKTYRPQFLNVTRSFYKKLLVLLDRLRSVLRLKEREEFLRRRLLLRALTMQVLRNV